MLEINLERVSKRFQYEWIFRDLTLSISKGSKLAITGSNGSGKSTLLKCISGLIPFTSGKSSYTFLHQSIDLEQIYRHIGYSAPYMELPEEFSLAELITFHFKFKTPSIDPSEMADLMYLNEHRHKPISQFSSGMRQRLKLGLSLFSEAPLLMFDEPTSNLDEKGISWYKEMISLYARKKTILVCSNDPKEYSFCDDVLCMEDFKQPQKL
jgi:ABC-type multidrug transport system ATPase subunit